MLVWGHVACRGRCFSRCCGGCGFGAKVDCYCTSYRSSTTTVATAIHSFPSPNLIRLGRVNPLSYYRFGTSALNGDSCYDPRGLALPLHHLWICNVAHREVSTHMNEGVSNVKDFESCEIGLRVCSEKQGTAVAYP